MFDFWKGSRGGDAEKKGSGGDVQGMGHLVREHMIFHGRVQGVGFRFTASHIAKRLFLTGWVHNCSDGTVEAELQGEAQAIADFLREMQGQPYIVIDSVERSVLPVVPEKGFRVSDYGW